MTELILSNGRKRFFRDDCIDRLAYVTFDCDKRRFVLKNPADIEKLDKLRCIVPKVWDLYSIDGKKLEGVIVKGNYLMQIYYWAILENGKYIGEFVPFCKACRRDDEKWVAIWVETYLCVQTKKER